MGTCTIIPIDAEIPYLSYYQNVEQEAEQG